MADLATLNLGAGHRIEREAVNHDRIKHCAEIDVVHDLDVLPWPWADASFDAIIARSVLEHLRLTLVEALDECWRILRPGGVVHVKAPLWTHENAYTDPTHRWRYTLHSFDLFDPRTRLGQELDFYTTRKWAIVRGPQTNEPVRSGVYVTLRVMK